MGCGKPVVVPSGLVDREDAFGPSVRTLQDVGKDAARQHGCGNGHRAACDVGSDVGSDDGSKRLGQRRLYGRRRRGMAASHRQLFPACGCIQP
jgi:hypothetical protein